MRHEEHGDGRRARLGGSTLIAGAAMGLVTMALHPTGHEAMRDVATARLSVAVHALGIAAAPTTLHGAWVLTRRLARRAPSAELALAFQGLAAVAAVLAATASGFLATALARRAAGETGAARELTMGLLRYTGTLNQASARILVGASSLAILLWSIAILRTRLLGRPTGVLGGVVAAATLAVLLAGRLRLDVHGFGAVVLAQAVWLALVGLELRRRPPLPL
jgi:hypothetical protein